MGSVKDLIIKKKPSEKELGVGIFKFTDDYSVFDYGKMPDRIPGKGEALCRMAAYNFKELGKIGIKSHFRKLISGNEMEVSLVRILNPEKNELYNGTVNYLVPLELIFRNSLPEGSSVFKRVANGETSWKEIGIDFEPKPGTKLKKPIFDVSTKLERLDRYLSWEEAQEISKLSDAQMKELRKNLSRINEFLNKKAEKLGLEHADGKVEFAVDEKGKLILVDVVGTLDENRMLYKGMHISKQVLRDYYNNKTDWGRKMAEAKKSGVPEEKWPVPPRLPKELIEITGNMYKAVCEQWANENIWGAPKIPEVIESYRKFTGK